MPKVCDAMITICLDARTISGVYLPPSLSLATVEEVLQRASMSDVVLGDINVRFATRGGGGSPKDRARVVVDWAQAAGLLHLQPQGGRSNWPVAFHGAELTVDHCFIRPSQISRALYLLLTRRLRLRTDHTYLLLVCLGDVHWEQQSTSGPLRFGIWKLLQPAVVERLQERWAQEEASSQGLWQMWRTDIDRFDSALVTLC